MVHADKVKGFNPSKEPTAVLTMIPLKRIAPGELGFNPSKEPTAVLTWGFGHLDRLRGRRFNPSKEPTAVLTQLDPYLIGEPKIEFQSL